ncbi:MAG: alanine--tRNA ligase, partial [Chloroflexota bacterium]|nr:alanine--tRNA ligase [Chloroflexota bacterium]
MSAADLRERYQRFFEARGHTRVPAAPLLARDDPTLLFVNSGMVQFKRVLTGEEKRDYKRAVDAQPVLRVAGKHNDFEQVGRTPRHNTLFEMLGNWSFGDYFKREAIHWAWEFLTLELEIDPARLAATVYTDDDDAYRIWTDEIGLPSESVVRWGDIAAGDDHNFWQMADTGPCGPCSEIHFDRGAELSEGPDCIPDHSETCPRWLEFWNLVFMQYDRAGDGTLTPLPFPSVDTGMGLERMASILQGVDSNYQTDLFAPIIDRLAAHLGHRPEQVEAERFSYQVVADHSRAMTFLIGEGVKPSNEGAGYVLRRIMRRAVRHLRLMGIREPVLAETCDAVIDLMGAAYPNLENERDRILGEVRTEETKFARTLEAGTERLASLVSAAAGVDNGIGSAHDASVVAGPGAGAATGTGNGGDASVRIGGIGMIAGEDAFRLHDTFGFPIDLTVEIAAESGVTVDRAGFDAAMEKQRERSRKTVNASLTFDAAIQQELAGQKSAFVGYPNETKLDGANVSGRYRSDDGRFVLVLDRTPFYPEGGGQIGDRGQIAGPQGSFMVEDTQRQGDAILHLGKDLEGSVGVQQVVVAQVDEVRRWAAARNHTGTHLLHRALRDVLGEQAKQAGSWVGPEGLRFDFPADQPTPRESLRQVERIVNAQIRRNAAVIPTQMSLAEAQALGADMFFGDKYLPESVRVVRVDGFSKELCGGTHVAATGQIGSFLITAESSIGAGLRRIEAVTGEAAEELIAGRLEALRTTAALLGAPDEEVPGRVEALLGRLRDAERSARSAPAAPLQRLDAAATLASAQEADGTKVMVEH